MTRKEWVKNNLGKIKCLDVCNPYTGDFIGKLFNNIPEVEGGWILFTYSSDFSLEDYDEGDEELEIITNHYLKQEVWNNCDEGDLECLYDVLKNWGIY